MRTFLAVFLLLSTTAVAKDRYFFVIEKQQVKAQNRWSLSEWLEQRDRMRLMDLWLAIHSPSPYEFFLLGDYQWGEMTYGGNFRSGSLGFTAYATLIGLEVQREFSSDVPRWYGLLHLRLFGYHYQGTHLRVELGFKQESRSGSDLWSPALGLGFNFYLTRHFGLEFLYRHYFPASSLGVESSGDRFEMGTFVDFSFARLFGTYVREWSGGTIRNPYAGGRVGTKLFF